MAWACWCAFALRHAAEEARSSAIDRLREYHIAALGTPGVAASKPAILKDLIDEVRTLSRGAFQAFRQQPVVKAILVPSGFLGLWEVAHKLFSAS